MRMQNREKDSHIGKTRKVSRSIFYQIYLEGSPNASKFSFIKVHFHCTKRVTVERSRTRIDIPVATDTTPTSTTQRSYQIYYITLSNVGTYTFTWRNARKKERKLDTLFDKIIRTHNTLMYLLYINGQSHYM